MDAPLYNSEILRLAASIPHAARLDAPQASAQRSSPICGSRVTVDLALDSGGHVVGFGQEVRACALGQASASILGRHILGETAQSLGDARDLLMGWLKGDGPLPEALAARFPELALFLPAVFLDRLAIVPFRHSLGVDPQFPARLRGDAGPSSDQWRAGSAFHDRPAWLVVCVVAARS